MHMQTLYIVQYIITHGAHLQQDDVTEHVFITCTGCMQSVTEHEMLRIISHGLSLSLRHEHIGEYDWHGNYIFE